MKAYWKVSQKQSFPDFVNYVLEIYHKSYNQIPSTIYCHKDKAKEIAEATKIKIIERPVNINCIILDNEDNNESQSSESSRSGSAR